MRWRNACLFLQQLCDWLNAKHFFCMANSAVYRESVRSIFRAKEVTMMALIRMKFINKNLSFVHTSLIFDEHV